MKKTEVKLTAPDRPRPLLFEIGTEELPPADLDYYLSQLEEIWSRRCWRNCNLNYGNLMVMGTPRRLVVYLECLDNEQDDREELVKGPPAERAFGPDGEPTKAAEGFARGKGIPVSDLEVREIDGGEYVVATVQHKGQTSRRGADRTPAGIDRQFEGGARHALECQQCGFLPPDPLAAGDP